MICDSQGAKADPAALKRLKRVEGQIRGIIQMVESHKECTDILTQIAAARSALHKAGMVILKNHMEGCVTRAIAQGDGKEIMDELLVILDRSTK